MKKTTINKSLIKSENLFPVVGIGASAGGLDAFKKLLKAIPEDSGMAFVLVQHLDPTHESLLPELLQKVTRIPVLEISDDLKVQPDHIYIIPSNKILIANDGLLELSPRPALPGRGAKSNTRNMPIDLFFSSLAEVHQTHAIGVVLSGTASDGTAGLRAIKDHGGLTFAQDKESATYDSMPVSAVQAGVVDFILPPHKIPLKILEITKTMLKGGGEPSLHQQDEEVMKQIISLLRIRKGTDFTYYKQTTVRRRILRRMALNKNEEPTAYLTYLKNNKEEQDILYQDMLIPVTTFFRDPKSFEHLKNTVLPKIIKSKITDSEFIRIWVAGCSTGQEAYSIAICLKELLGSKTKKTQIFATDISEPAIIKARSGVYTKHEVDNISTRRLQECFTKTNDSYSVKKSIRDMCLFANHNFLKDPPFGKMDLISCRNVLIYMEPYLQRKALTTFHYSLNPRGFLLLGKTETTATVSDFFTTAVKTEKLFTRKDVPSRSMHVASPRSEQVLSHEGSGKGEIIRTDFQKTADDIMLSKYTPAGVVVSEAMDIVHFRGNTSNYLEQSAGKPTHNLLKMAKYGLAFDLRSILHKVKKSKTTEIKKNIEVGVSGSLRNISIEVIPLPNTLEPYYLILFHETHPAAKTQSIKKSSKQKVDLKDLRITQLEQELAQTHEDMRGITEEQEATNEELQTDNEELMSGSEELQSLNEELETSKEELQSTNEELTVVNQEIVSLNEQVMAARDYAEAIVATVREPLIVLDASLRIKTANASFYKTFHLTEQEVEGQLLYEVDNKHWNIVELRTILQKMISEKSVIIDFEIVSTFPAVGERVLLLNARALPSHGSESLILLAIEDITERVFARKKNEISEAKFRSFIEAAPIGIGLFIGRDLVIENPNQQFIEIVGKGPDIVGKRLVDVMPELIEYGQPYLKILDDVFTSGKMYKSLGDSVNILRNGLMHHGFYNIYYVPLFDTQGNVYGIMDIATDVTEQILAKNKFIELQSKHADELEEKVKQRTQDLLEANMMLEFQNEEIEARAEELIIANKELAFQSSEKEKRSDELIIANKELAFQNEEKEKRSAELIIANKELDSFTYVASHDLQEPLRKIQTFAARLLEKETENLSDYGKDYFARMQNAATRMQQLITDLLSFSHLSTAERKFEITDLGKIVDEVKSDFKEKLEEKKGLIEVISLGKLNIIPFQFRQLLQNLIGNSLKFASPERAIHIRIGTEIIKGDQILKKDFNTENTDQSKRQAGASIISIVPEKMYCHLSVVDNGIGFDQQFSERIFQVFQRLHGKDQYPGTGIGLAIVKKIVDNHKGFVTASSELNKGTCIDIYIPE